MVRRWFYGLSTLILGSIGLVALVWPPVLIALVVVLPLFAVGLIDALQGKSSIRRNFPLVGRLRYLFESVRPEIQQYFIELNTDAYPIERELRSVVYQRAKGELETQPFGTQRDVYRVGYEWAAHSLHKVACLEDEPRIVVGGPDCAVPYTASRLNIAAMSFGALSPTAIRSLSRGARKGGFAHNTGEGGISAHHVEGGGDLIWQVGTGYFGCRSSDGSFDPERFRDAAAVDQVRMIELKLSQGAKPGHGGILPAPKVTPEIAAVRGVPAYQTVASPPWHSAFSGLHGLMEFVARLRELSGGKPVGFKLCVSTRVEFLSVCRAMLETGITPDFIAVDGGEGGTGAAPLEFANSMGMPARDAWVFVHNALVGTGLRDRIRIFASGRIFTGFHIVRAMALGADVCYSARGMMLALGCIQALRCNRDNCPSGVATQNPALFNGLDVTDKSERVFRYHHGTVRSFLEMLSAMGLAGPAEISPDRIFRRVDDMQVKSFSEIYDFLRPRQLLDGDGVPALWQREWAASGEKTAVAEVSGHMR